MEHTDSTQEGLGTTRVSYCASDLQVGKNKYINISSTNLHSKEYEDSNGRSYGEPDTSNWEYHPEHVDGKVWLMVDEVLGIHKKNNYMYTGNDKITGKYKLIGVQVMISGNTTGNTS